VDSKVREIDDTLTSVKSEIAKQVEANKDKKEHKFAFLKDIKGVDFEAGKLRKRCEAVIAGTAEAGEGFLLLVKKFEERKKEIDELAKFCDNQVMIKKAEEAGVLEDLGKKLSVERAGEVLAALAV
jgi:hypothetical protein